MSIVPHLRDLYQHLEWADSTIWRTVFSNPLAVGDSGIHDRLAHCHLVQWAHLSAWQGTPFDLKGFGSPPVEELALRARDYHAAVHRYLESVDEATVGRQLVVPWLDVLEQHWKRKVAPLTVAEGILQVAMHSAYHRGQVNARLRELGAEPPLTDYIVWIWFGRPPAEWPTLPAQGDAADSKEQRP